MWRDLKRRLARAEVATSTRGWGDRQAAATGSRSGRTHEICELIRERLRAIGIDPALAVTLRCAEEAAAELAAIPDTPDLQAADEGILRSEYNIGDDGAREVGRILPVWRSYTVEASAG